MFFIQKTIAQMSRGVAFNLKEAHEVFDCANIADVERFVVDVYNSAPLHVRLALGGVSIYMHILGLMLFARSIFSLTPKQVGALVGVMSVSSFGLFRAYARFFSNLVTLVILPEGSCVD